MGHIGPLLAWAVVFADLGTSVFYVPGILYAQVGGLAPVFVLIATVAFVFVAFEHLEIAHRYPQGGGGVAAVPTVAKAMRSTSGSNSPMSPGAFTSPRAALYQMMAKRPASAA